MTDSELSKESRIIKFILLILVSTLSSICAGYIFYNVIKYPIIRRRFHNQTLIIHVILVALYTLFNIPTTISFYARGEPIVNNYAFCIAWEVGDYIFSSSIIWCKALLTIERYVLVFHPQYLRSQRQQFLFHTLPLIFMFVYVVHFYLLINLFCPSSVKPNPKRYMCGDQCLDEPMGISNFSWIFNILFPVFIVIFGSLILLLRVIWKRREMQRNLRNWSKNWKMIVQLLGLASIYAIIWLPLSVISMISLYSHSSESVETIDDHFYYMTFHCELIVTIMAFIFWPEMTQRLRRRFRSNSIVSVAMGIYSTN